jgi:hypothetical protein
VCQATVNICLSKYCSAPDIKQQAALVPIPVSLYVSGGSEGFGDKKAWESSYVEKFECDPRLILLDEMSVDKTVTVSMLSFSLLTIVKHL